MKNLIIVKNNKKQAIEEDQLKFLNKGGTAEVYLFEQDGKPKAIKLYLEDVLNKHGKEYQTKLSAMLNSVPQNISFTVGKDTYTQFAWPEAIVEDDAGNLVGYLMPLLPKTKLYELTEYNKDVNSLAEQHHSITYRIQVANNLAKAVDNLHRAGHYFIDMKTQNIFVFKDSATICFIDCDGFSINQGKHKAEHFSPGYVLPEALRKQQTPQDLSDKPYQDYYCLAHLIFEILEFGRIKPFDGIATDVSKLPNDGDTYGFKVKESWYPYGLNKNPNINPHQNAINSYFPISIRKLFERAFTGKTNQIPTADEWLTELGKHIDDKNFQKCDKHPDKRYHDHFKNQPCFGCEVYDGNKKKTNNSPQPETTQSYATELIDTPAVNTNKPAKNLLSNDQIEKEIPKYTKLTLEQIMRLKALINWAKKKNISDDYISDDLETLYETEHLALDGKFLNELPTHIGVLKNLKTLNISNNNLISLPSTITTLPKLEKLIADDNNISDIDLPFDQLKNLKVLSLNRNVITELPRSLASTNSLEEIKFVYNQIEYIDDAVYGLPNLKQILTIGNPLEETRSSSSDESFYSLKQEVEDNIKCINNKYLNNASLSYQDNYYENQSNNSEIDIDDYNAWQQACREDSIVGYQSYINEYPNGKFVEKAKEAIDDLNFNSLKHDVYNQNNSTNLKPQPIKKPNNVTYEEFKDKYFEGGRKHMITFNEGALDTAFSFGVITSTLTFCGSGITLDIVLNVKHVNEFLYLISIFSGLFVFAKVLYNFYSKRSEYYEFEVKAGTRNSSVEKLVAVYETAYSNDDYDEVSITLSYNSKTSGYINLKELYSISQDIKSRKWQ